jgi:hypothetical protein
MWIDSIPLTLDVFATKEELVVASSEAMATIHLDGYLEAG